MVPGLVSDSEIHSTGDLGKLTVGSAQNSGFFAGTNASSSTLPASAADFLTQDQIISFTVKGGPFANSNVAASHIGKVMVRSVTASNGGTQFGIAAQSLTMFNNVGVLKWNSKKDPALLVPDGDFVVRLL